MVLLLRVKIHTFGGWFEDGECTSEFTHSTVETETTFHIGWVYTVTFDFKKKNSTITTKRAVWLNFQLPQEQDIHLLGGSLKDDIEATSNKPVTPNHTLSMHTGLLTNILPHSH